MVSYSLSICDLECKNPKLVRRFHFDYDLSSVKTNQSIPIFHFQYAGELSPYLKKLGVSNQHMNPELSEPRVYYQPVTLALLLNLVFNEFRNEITNKILQTPEWFALIKANEEKVLKPYYKYCNEFLQSAKNDKKLFTNDFCYGN